mmetsp:Transcript_30898/g.81110  ORF Transcript_30898/g.81110 Transcript_30898/m.81110 type:complete len:1322 (-) Transcript_30898:1907-5872(-)
MPSLLLSPFPFTFTLYLTLHPLPPLHFLPHPSLPTSHTYLELMLSTRQQRETAAALSSLLADDGEEEGEEEGEGGKKEVSSHTSLSRSKKLSRSMKKSAFSSSKDNIAMSKRKMRRESTLTTTTDEAEMTDSPRRQYKEARRTLAEEGYLDTSPLFGTPFKQWQARPHSVPVGSRVDDLREHSSSSMGGYGLGFGQSGGVSPMPSWMSDTSAGRGGGLTLAPLHTGGRGGGMSPPFLLPDSPSISPIATTLQHASITDSVAPRMLAPAIVAQEYIKCCVELGVQPNWVVVKDVLPNRSLTLNLENQHIGDKGAMALGVILSRNTSVRSVNVAKNEVGDAGFAVMVDGIEQSEQLDPSGLADEWSDEEEEGGSEGSMRREEEVAERKELKRLAQLGGCIIDSINVSENRITYKGIERLAKLLSFEGKDLYERPLLNHRLRTLILSGNRIGDRGVTVLTSSLIGNVALRKLHLSRVGMGMGGCRGVGDLLVASDMLVDVDVSWNRISAEGVEPICAGMKSSSSLRVINLSWNALGDAGAVSVAEALTENQSLEVIDVSSNRFSYNAAASLAGALSSSDSSLRQLKIEGNNLTREGCIVLMSCLQSNPMLEAIEMKGSSLTSKSDGLPTRASRARVGGERGGDKEGDAPPSTRTNLSSNSRRPPPSPIPDQKRRKNSTRSLRPTQPQRELKVSVKDKKGGKGGGGAVSADVAVLQDVQVFDEETLTGKYELELRVGMQRTIAVRLCEVILAEKGTGFKSVSLDGEAVPIDDIVSKRLRWPRHLPRSGRLVVEYSSLQSNLSLLRPLQEGDLVSLLNTLSDERYCDYERLALLKSLCATTSFTASQVEQILRFMEWTTGKAEALVQCSLRISDPQNFLGTLRSQPSSISQHVEKRLGQLLFFHKDNPTARYKLTLSNYVESMICKIVLDFLRTEDENARIRHALLDGSEIEINPSTFQIPDEGLLSFSYVTSKFSEYDESTLDSPDSLEVTRHLADLAQIREPSMMINSIRHHANYHTYTVRVARSILEAVDDTEYQAHAFIAVYGRVVDRQNMWALLQSLDRNVVNVISYNIGWKNLLDDDHPENHYRLDLENEEDREVLERLYVLQKRYEGQNWINVTIKGQPAYFPERGDFKSIFPRWGMVEFDFVTGHLARRARILYEESVLVRAAERFRSTIGLLADRVDQLETKIAMGKRVLASMMPAGKGFAASAAVVVMSLSSHISISNLQRARQQETNRQLRSVVLLQNRFREMLVSRRIRLMTNIAALKIQDFMKRHFQKQQEKEEKEAEKAKSGRKGEKKESESKRPSGVHATTIKPPLRRSRS